MRQMVVRYRKLAAELAVSDWPHRLFDQMLGAPACLLCDAITVGRIALCIDCRHRLPWIGDCCRICSLPLAGSFDRLGLLCGKCLSGNPPLDLSLIPLRYARPVNELILRFKNSSDLVAGNALAGLLRLEILARFPARFASCPPTIVPIPLHPVRLRQRGFNQAVELARPLARATGWPLQTNLLHRQKNTPSFQGMSAAVRRRHARGLFAVGHTAIVPASVLLIDDVVTTTATAYSAAQTLRRNGCEHIALAAIARTDL